MSSPIWWNLVFIKATSAAYTWVNVGDTDCADTTERDNNPLIKRRKSKNDTNNTCISPSSDYILLK